MAAIRVGCPAVESQTSLLADLEVCVCLHDLRNLDLSSQGWYAVRVKLVPQGARVFAHPSRVLTVESKAAALEGPPELQWQIEDDLSSFRSRTFLIRYAQEEVLLGEVACFHVHLDALQGLQQTDCLLEFQLMFQAPSKTRILEPPALINMKCVAKQTFRMVACANGYHEYCPVQFDTTHMVLCNVTLHATLLGLGCGTLDMDQAAPRGSWSDSPGLRRQRRHSAASVVGPVQRSERSTGSFTQILTDHLSCTRCTRCVSLDLVRTGTGLLPNELASATSAPTGNSLASTTLLAHGSGGSDQLLSNTSSADGSAVDENADLRSDVPNRRGRSHRARRGSAIPAYGADYGASRIPDLVAEMDELAQGDLAGHNPLVHFLQCDTCARAAAAEGAWSEAAMHSGVHARMQHVYEKLTGALDGSIASLADFMGHLPLGPKFQLPAGLAALRNSVARNHMAPGAAPQHETEGPPRPLAAEASRLGRDHGPVLPQQLDMTAQMAMQAAPSQQQFNRQSCELPASDAILDSATDLSGHMSRPRRTTELSTSPTALMHQQAKPPSPKPSSGHRSPASGPESAQASHNPPSGHGGYSASQQDAIGPASPACCALEDMPTFAVQGLVPQQARSSPFPAPGHGAPDQLQMPSSPFQQQSLNTMPSSSAAAMRSPAPHMHPSLVISPPAAASLRSQRHNIVPLLRLPGSRAAEQPTPATGLDQTPTPPRTWAAPSAQPSWNEWATQSPTGPALEAGGASSSSPTSGASFVASLPPDWTPATAAAAMMHNWAGRRVQVAANWTCLIWILRHAALQLLGLLKQRWEAAQVEAFSMWVMDGPHAAASPAPLAGTKSQRRKSQSYVMDLKTSLLGLSPRFSYPGKPQAQSLSPGLSPRLGKPERSPNSLFSMARSLACMSASASVTLEMADLDSLGDDKSWDGSESGASAASSLHGRIPAMRSHHSAANLPKDAAIGECRAPQELRQELKLSKHRALSRPRLQDQHLYRKPHRQPLLFVDDSLAPSQRAQQAQHAPEGLHQQHASPPAVLASSGSGPQQAALGMQGASGHPAILAFSEPNPQPPASGLQMAVGQHSLGQQAVPSSRDTPPQPTWSGLQAAAGHTGSHQQPNDSLANRTGTAAERSTQSMFTRSNLGQHVLTAMGEPSAQVLLSLSTTTPSLSQPPALSVLSASTAALAVPQPSAAMADPSPDLDAPPVLSLGMGISALPQSSVALQDPKDPTRDADAPSTDRQLLRTRSTSLPIPLSPAAALPAGSAGKAEVLRMLGTADAAGLPGPLRLAAQQQLAGDSAAEGRRCHSLGPPQSAAAARALFRAAGVLADTHPAPRPSLETCAAPAACAADGGALKPSRDPALSVAALPASAALETPATTAMPMGSSTSSDAATAMHGGGSSSSDTAASMPSDMAPAMPRGASDSTMHAKLHDMRPAALNPPEASSTPAAAASASYPLGGVVRTGSIELDRIKPYSSFTPVTARCAAVQQARGSLERGPTLTEVSTKHQTAGNGTSVQQSSAVSANDISVQVRHEISSVTPAVSSGTTPKRQSNEEPRTRAASARGTPASHDLPREGARRNTRPSRELARDSVAPRGSQSPQGSECGTPERLRRWASCLGASGSGRTSGEAAAPELPPVHVHVVVLVHGFQGSATDLRLIRNHIQVMAPGAICLMCKSNEGLTLDGFEAMGRRVAGEVAAFLQRLQTPVPAKGRPRKVLEKLTFIGHSIGNLTIRAALTEAEMQPFLPQLWLFLSISGPHLGYLCSSNRLFCSGLWLLKSFQQGCTLQQLSFNDAPLLRDCFLYKLAQHSGLALFRWVVLVASPQDQYVPLPSARVQHLPISYGRSEPGADARSADVSPLASCLPTSDLGGRGLDRSHRLGGAMVGSQSSGNLSSLAAGFHEAHLHQDVAVRGKREQVYAEMLDALVVDVEKARGTQLLRVDVDFPLKRWHSISNAVGRTAHIEFIETDVYTRFLLWAVLRRRQLL